MEGADGVTVVLLKLDLRRRRFLNALLMRLAVVCEPEDSSESLPLDEAEDSVELECPSIAKTPGWDSSSMIAWGVLSYIYACDLSWKSRYRT